MRSSGPQIQLDQEVKCLYFSLCNPYNLSRLEVKAPILCNCIVWMKKLGTKSLRPVFCTDAHLRADTLKQKEYEGSAMRHLLLLFPKFKSFKHLPQRHSS